MKYILKLMMVAFLFAACEEKDLSSENPAPPKENVSLTSSFLYEDEGFKRDSLYTNNLGQNFYLDDVKFLVSDFFIYLENGDTIRPEKQNYFAFSFDAQSYKMIALPAGGYTAKYGFTLGMDSLATASVNPEKTPANSGVRDLDIIRGDNFGYNALVIKGRYLDPLKPLDTVGTPFQYNIGGYELYRQLNSDWINFSVANKSEAKLFTVIQLSSILADFDIKKRLIILSDYSNPIDLNIAQTMLFNLNIELF